MKLNTQRLQPTQVRNKPRSLALADLEQIPFLSSTYPLQEEKQFKIVFYANKNCIMEFQQTKAKVSIRMLFDVWIAAFSFWNSQHFET